MNSRKNNHQSESAVSGADPVITQFQRYQAVLADTGVAIPRLLQKQRRLREELGRAEIGVGDVQAVKERLDAANAGLESTSRQRAAACEALLSLGDGLRQSRAAAAEELTEIAQATVTDFEARWSRAVAELSQLHSEAAMLSRALRVNVTAKPPCVATLSADGTRMQVSFAGRIETDTVLPEKVSAIIARIDAFDAAFSLVAAIGQAREWDARHVALQRSRSGNMPVMSGVYTVTRPFDLWGARFEVGMLVSTDVMGPGMMHRRWLAREVLPLEGAAVAAA